MVVTYSSQNNVLSECFRKNYRTLSAWIESWLQMDCKNAILWASYFCLSQNQLRKTLRAVKPLELTMALVAGSDSALHAAPLIQPSPHVSNADSHCSKEFCADEITVSISRDDYSSSTTSELSSTIYSLSPNSYATLSTCRKFVEAPVPRNYDGVTDTLCDNTAQPYLGFRPTNAPNRPSDRNIHNFIASCQDFDFANNADALWNEDQFNDCASLLESIGEPSYV
jgi:hypothetical protein